MRIIAGEMRGRRLKTIPGWQTRPTADKVKGAIFNVLGSKVRGARVLDLFAGTGNLGIEALSRGAVSAVFVDKNYAAWKVIQENLSLFPDKQVQVKRMDALAYLESLDPSVEFDLIFLDPPYRQGWVEKVLGHLQKVNHLSDLGVIVIETAADEQLPEQLAPFEVRIVKEYGDTKVWYLQFAENRP